MSSMTYLAAVDEPPLGRDMSECLVLYLADTDEPENCLLDPAVISLRPAAGHWCLLYFDREGGRAYYSRFEQSFSLVCEVHGARYVDETSR